MLAYYDTGTLVPLYMEEAFSFAINTFVQHRNEVIPVHLFHQLELANAFRLKVFRGEISEDICKDVADKIALDMSEGRFVIRPVNWINAFTDARRIGEKVSARSGCRTLDLLHVAIAMQWESDIFVTADDRQLKGARSAGLRTVDVRTLPMRDGKGAVIREGSTRYGTRRKRRLNRTG